MPANNPEAFPWGSNNPSLRRRLLVAILIAVVSSVTLYLHYVRFNTERSDFSQALFGARAMLHDADPYVLVGPSRVYESRWPVMYPATTYVAAIPFTPLADVVAAALFIAISTFLLAYGSTAGSWHRLPMFASIAFSSSVQFAQWSILMTAILFLPWLAVFAAVKPQAAFPLIAVARPAISIKAALIGGVLLVLASLAMFPSWPAEWFRIVRDAEQLRAPLMRLGGFCILLVLLRWRRPEAWLVFLMALMPQTWGWYNVLPLLAVAATYREACVLSLVSSAGALATAYMTRHLPPPASYPPWGAAQVAFAYLPATIAVLRRPNANDRAPWMSRVQNADRLP